MNLRQEAYYSWINGVITFRTVAAYLSLLSQVVRSNSFSELSPHGSG